MLGHRDQVEQDLICIEEQIQELREEIDTHELNNESIIYTIMDLSRGLTTIAMEFNKVCK